MDDTEYEVKWPVAMLTYMGYAIVILVSSPTFFSPNKEDFCNFYTLYLDWTYP